MRNFTLLALTFSLFFFGSCSKERPEELVQGTPENLQSLSDYQGKVLDLQTGGDILNSRIQSSTDNVQIKEGVEGLNVFKFVEFSVATDLLDGVPFRGRANTSYKIQFEVTPTKLIIYKIGKKKDIPFLELTSATLIESGQLKGMYSVPLAYYPISLYRLEHIKDSNGNNTHKLSTFSSQDPKSATHITFSKEDRVRIKLDKPDVFPASLFDGEWFYAATIVSTNFENANLVGRDLSVDFEAAPVSRIKFVALKDQIRGVNLNVDQNIDTKDHINLKAALTIPVTRIDYSREKVGGYLNPTETAFDESNDESIPWRKRRYIKIDFAAVDSILTDGKEGEVSNLEIDKDYISFTVYYEDDQTRIKYALRKAHAPIKGRVYHSSDRSKFGFFKTKKHFIRNHTTYREKDFEKKIFLNRFYPSNGKITYYFSHSTPRRYYEAGERAIKAWNDAFKAAGSSIQVEIGKEVTGDQVDYKTVSLGDIRYNILNIMETKNGASLLGYGPSIVDSESGQIISATCNTYINPFREGIIGTLRNYIKMKHGILKAKYLGHVNLDEINNDITSKVVAAMSIEKQLINSNLGKHAKNVLEAQLSRYKESINKEQRKVEKLIHNFKLFKQGENVSEFQYKKFNNNEDVYEYLLALSATDNSGSKYTTDHNSAYKLSFMHDHKFGEQCNYSRTMHDEVSNIEKNCPDFVAYTLELKEKGVTHDENEIEQLYACSEKLIDHRVVSTLVHEIGHNIGLRHNFAGSSDPSNYSRDDKGNILAKTSSIMDYPINDVRELIVPGKYDIAAVAFGYTNSIEIEGQENRSTIPSGHSIDQYLSKENKKRRSYRFCTDQDASLVDSIDPLCEKFDHGSNPEEVVDTIIDRFNSTYATYAHRYDRAKYDRDGNKSPSDQRYANILVGNTFFPLKRIYDQWRYHFAAFLDDKEKYLENFGTEDFKEKVKEMSEDPGRHGENYRLYYKASQKIYSFLSRLISSPVKYCLAKAEEGPFPVVPLDFESYRHKVYKTYEVTINNCDHPKLAELLKSEKPTKILMDRSLGAFFNTINKDKNIANRDDYETNEVLGMKTAKALALEMLTARLPLMKQLRDSNFEPSMMDNLIYRQDLGNKILNRILSGVSPSVFGQEEIKTTFPFFSLEKDLLVKSYSSYVASNEVPGKLELTGDRRQIFSVGGTRVQSQIPEGAVVTKFMDIFLFATPDSVVGTSLVKARETLRKNIQDANEGVSPVTVEEVKEEIKKLGLPATLEDLKQVQFVAFLQPLQQVILPFPESKTGGMKDALEKVWEPVFNLWGALLQALQGGTIGQEHIDMSVYQVLTEVMKLDPKVIMLTEDAILPTVEPAMKPLTEEWAIRSQAIEKTRLHQDEYEAQLNMLTELLMI